MGQMFDALKQIEPKPGDKPSDMPCDDNSSSPGPPEAELSFPDELLADTAALLDEYENGESQTPALIEENSPPRDSRHTDLAANILTQIPARGPVALLFAAPKSTGVFAPSLVPLFSTLAERASGPTDGRTLVVECDFHRAALAARFAVEPEAGLGDVLASRAEWRSAVCRTEQENLDVICARAAGSAVAQTLASWPKLKTILEEMQKEYRLVLLENVSATDDEMSQLAALCHGAYLLIRAGQTPRRAARESVVELKNSGGQLLGCILLDS